MTQDFELLEKKILLRPDEVAKILRVSKRSVYRRCLQGRLKIAAAQPIRITAQSVKNYIGINFIEEEL